MLQKQHKSTTNKYIVEDENSFQNFLQNKIDDITFIAFDESEIEKKLPFYLKALEVLSKDAKTQIEILANSPLILIAIPLLKKIAGLQLIELTATRGKRPEEIIKTAKTLRSHGLAVRVRYLKK